MTDPDSLFRPFRGMTLGLVGFGRLGQAFRLAALKQDMQVLVYDPQKASEQSEEEYEDILTQWGNGMGGCCTVREEPVVFLPLGQLQKRADILVFAVPVTPETRGMISRSFQDNMKPGAKIFNFSGPDLLAADALRSGVTDCD